MGMGLDNSNPTPSPMMNTNGMKIESFKYDFHFLNMSNRHLYFLKTNVLLLLIIVAVYVDKSW